MLNCMNISCLQLFYDLLHILYHVILVRIIILSHSGYCRRDLLVVFLDD